MELDPIIIPVAAILLSLLMPWLYDGSMFTREVVWKRRFDRAERKRLRYTGSEIQDIRSKARRSL